MKKTIVFFMCFFLTCATSCTDNSKIQNITYKGFIEEIWDFEQHPDTLVFKGNTAVIIDYYSKRCRPCMELLPIMEKMAEEYEGDLTIYNVNVDEETRLANVFKVKGLPVIYRIPASGKYIKRHDGLPSEETLKRIIETELLDKPKQDE